MTMTASLGRSGDTHSCSPHHARDAVDEKVSGRTRGSCLDCDAVSLSFKVRLILLPS